MGGDQGRPNCQQRLIVSIHAPGWGATSAPRRSSAARRRFDPRPRMRGAPTGRSQVTTPRPFRSTPPDGGRRDQAVGPRALDRVSIHAPGWGATSAPRRSSAARRRFDPRPRMRGDPTGRSQVTTPRPFRSTPPDGGRRDQAVGPRALDRVSIHAPGWGATYRIRNVSEREIEFRSTPPDGGRRGFWWSVSNLELFRSTPPDGGRHLLPQQNVLIDRFRSTPPDGGRRMKNPPPMPRVWFRSTPPDGGRQAILADLTALAGFRSTPPDGGRRACPVGRG